MKNDRTEKKFHGFLSKAFFIASLCFLLLVVVGLFRETLKKRDLDREISSLDAELMKLKLDKKNFLDSMAIKESDFYLEETARNKFNMKKPGESVVVVEASALSDSKMVDNNSFGNKGISNAEAWWNYFFGVLN